MDIDIHIDIHEDISPNTHPRTIYTIYTIYIYPNIVIRLDIYIRLGWTMFPFRFTTWTIYAFCKALVPYVEYQNQFLQKACAYCTLFNFHFQNVCRKDLCILHFCMQQFLILSLTDVQDIAVGCKCIFNPS
jgi:hypothetical protein